MNIQRRRLLLGAFIGHIVLQGVLAATLGPRAQTDQPALPPVAPMAALASAAAPPSTAATTPPATATTQTPVPTTTTSTVVDQAVYNAQGVVLMVSVPPPETDPAFAEAMRICPPSEAIRLGPVPRELPAFLLSTAFIPNPITTDVPTAQVVDAFVSLPPEDLFPNAQVILHAHKLTVELFGEEHWPAYCQLGWHESKWDPRAVHPRSGACGLAQSLPCWKVKGIDMDSQMRWALDDHIKTRRPDKFTNPTEAWEYWKSQGYPCGPTLSDFCGGNY